MKLLPTLALTALMAAGSAFAATTPTPTATPAAAATPAAKHHSAAHCEKEAKAKNLTGADEKKFVKDCRDGKAG
jgi:hypothetical protein